MNPRACRHVLLSTLSVCLAACMTPSAQLDFEPGTVATRWIYSVQLQNWRGMGELLADDAVYEDTTMRFFEREPIRLVGREAIVDFWAKSSADSGTSRLEYTLLDRFETGGVTVLHMHLEARVAGEFWGVDEETIPLSGRVTTVLTVDDGKVVHVHDHVDYANVMRQVEAMRRGEPR